MFTLASPLSIIPPYLQQQHFRPDVWYLYLAKELYSPLVSNSIEFASRRVKCNSFLFWTKQFNFTNLTGTGCRNIFRKSELHVCQQIYLKFSHWNVYTFINLSIIYPNLVYMDIWNLGLERVVNSNQLNFVQNYSRKAALKYSPCWRLLSFMI